MKIKKLMSICAMSLAVVCCTSVTTFAAQNNESRNNAAKQVAMNFYHGERVFNDIKIDINTPIKDYVGKDLINEIKDLDITYVDSKTKEVKNILNENLGLKENLKILSEYQDELKTQDNLLAIKELVKCRLEDYEYGNLAECIKCDFNTDKYGNLTVGKNMNGKTTVTLEKSNKVLFQVNSQNIYNMKNELSGINSWSELKAWMKNYAPDSIFKDYNIK